MDFNNYDREEDEGGKKNPKEEDLGFMVGRSAGSSKIPVVKKTNEEDSFLVRKSAGFSSEDTSVPPPVPVHHKDRNFLLKLRINPTPSEEIQDSGSRACSVQINDGFNSRPAVDEDNQVGSNSKKYSHVCKECNKVFSCGKALGGHMSSAHVQAKDHLRKLKIRQSESFIKIHDGSVCGDEETERYVCKLCDKEFPSSKSLYGHMRCHPDRHWRGMVPPSSRSKPHKVRARAAAVVVDDYDEQQEGQHHLDFDSDDYEEDEEGIKVFKNIGDDVFPVEDQNQDIIHLGVRDLSSALGSSWRTTRKRGRKSMVKLPLLEMDHRGNPVSKIEEELYAAAKELMSLIKSGEKVNHHEVQRVNLCTNKRKVSEITNEDDSDDSEETIDEEAQRKKTHVTGTRTGFNAQMSSSQQYFENVRRRLPVMDAEQAPENHMCSDCDKLFPSHQALGGHRSSYNKIKISVQNALVQPVDHNCHGHGLVLSSANSESAASDEYHARLLKFEGGDHHRLMKAAVDENNIHECEICGKTFSSGQELGGHKMCHYAAVAEGSSSSRLTSNPDDDDGGKSGRKMLDIDLNKKLDEPEY